MRDHARTGAFESLPEMCFHINPYSPFNREFVPAGVQSLLAHGGFLFPSAIPLGQHAALHIGPCPDFPRDLLEVLKALLARHPSVRAAYIAQLTTLNEGIEQTCLLAFDIAEGADAERVFQDVGTVVTEHMTPQSPCVDLALRPLDDSPIGLYLRDAQPFYEIGMGRFLPH
jgi:hypothetical protein